jgi:hypothetical protein
MLCVWPELVVPMRERWLNESAVYIRNHRQFLPNFKERVRQGYTIATPFVKSPINQVVRRSG